MQIKFKSKFKNNKSFKQNHKFFILILTKKFNKKAKITKANIKI